MADGAAATTKAAGPPDPLVGRVINDKFKVLAFIARGGMGKVYRAEQAPLGRICALKVLNASYTGEHDPAFHKRFFLEASMTSKLRHPNTVTVFDYGHTEDSIYYMAMEYLEGQTLHRAIRQAGHFQEERAAHIARQICRSLREAHSVGVVHRDLKPANVYLLDHGDEPDFVKVLDFGLVKDVSENHGEELTQAGLFMGSPKYMAPEQVRGGVIGPRTDIYALGVIMYEMLAGKVPFDRPTSLEILMAHANEPVPPIRKTNPEAKISPAMEETIARAMAKDPEDRFRSMDEVLAALKRLGAVPPADPSESQLTDLPATSGPQASAIIPATGAAAPPPPASTGAGSVLQAPLQAPRAKVSPWIVAVAAAGVLALVGVVVHGRSTARPAASPNAAVQAPAAAKAPTPAPAPASTASATAAPEPAAPASAGVKEVDVSSLPTPPPASSEPAAKPAASAEASPARAVVPRGAAAHPRPAAGTQAAKPAVNCNPSYFYDADGNKHFKPECFGQ